jgi:hypothetical protein
MVNGPEHEKDPSPGEEAALWADIERVWEALTDPSAERFPVPDDPALTDDLGEWWKGTLLEEAVLLMEKAQDATRLRQRCEADLELAMQAAARGDRRAEAFYLYRAHQMIARARELQDEVERALAERRPEDDPGTG